MNYVSRPPIRIPFTDQDGLPVEWTNFITELVRLFNQLQQTGATSARPNPAPFIGFMFFDTTVGRPIWAKTSTTWVYADGSAA